MKRGKNKVTYDSLASPTITSTFLIPFLAKLSSAIAAYSGENSSAVTCPDGPTASAQPMVEKPMNVPISSTTAFVSVVMKSEFAVQRKLEVLMTEMKVIQRTSLGTNRLGHPDLKLSLKRTDHVTRSLLRFDSPLRYMKSAFCICL